MESKSLTEAMVTSALISRTMSFVPPHRTSTTSLWDTRIWVFVPSKVVGSMWSSSGTLTIRA